MVQSHGPPAAPDESKPCIDTIYIRTFTILFRYCLDIVYIICKHALSSSVWLVIGDSSGHSNIVGPSIASLNECFIMFLVVWWFRYIHLWNPLELLRFLRLQNWSWACSWSFERSSRADLKDLIDLSWEDRAERISHHVKPKNRCRNKHIDYTEDIVKDILAQKKTLGSSWIIWFHHIHYWSLLLVI